MKLMAALLTVGGIVVLSCCFSFASDCHNQACSSGGSQWAEFTVLGTCPDPCDAALLNAVKAKAENRAREAANRECMGLGGPSCLCTGGSYSTAAPTCEPVSYDHDGDPETPPVQGCKYECGSIYGSGTCEEVQ